LNEIFTNSNDILCPVTYTYKVLNAASHDADMTSRFAIDADATTKMTFTYDNDQNVYDGKTIHYEVTATTAANLPLKVEITVIDKTTICKLASLSYNDANTLAYPTVVYTDEVREGATLNDIYSNASGGNCPLTEEIILQSDKVTPLNTL
jgi:hypothetical protein